MSDRTNETPKTNKRGARGLVATGTAAVLLISGLGLIGVSLASQREIPQPPGASNGPAIALASVGDFVGSRLALARPIATLPASNPTALDIPSIGVHSDVQRLGQTQTGAMETPSGPLYDTAAWYRYSPTPGELGPAILLGHVDSAANGPSVFFRLGEMQRGDRVTVTREDDSVAVFIVDEVRRYSKNDFPTKLVYGNIDHAGLRIVTCGGAFDDSTGHYLDNIVVFATLVGR